MLEFVLRCAEKFMINLSSAFLTCPDNWKTHLFVAFCAHCPQQNVIFGHRIKMVATSLVVSFAAVFWAVTQRSPQKRCVTAQKTAAKETTSLDNQTRARD